MLQRWLVRLCHIATAWLLAIAVLLACAPLILMAEPAAWAKLLFLAIAYSVAASLFIFAPGKLGRGYHPFGREIQACWPKLLASHVLFGCLFAAFWVVLAAMTHGGSKFQPLLVGGFTIILMTQVLLSRAMLSKA